MKVCIDYTLVSFPERTLRASCIANSLHSYLKIVILFALIKADKLRAAEMKNRYSLFKELHFTSKNKMDEK